MDMCVRNTKQCLFLLFSIIAIVSCNKKEASYIESFEYIESYTKWQVDRKQELETTWLPLRGLFFLKEGKQWVGTDSLLAIQFPADLGIDSLLEVELTPDSLIITPLSDKIKYKDSLFSDPVSWARSPDFDPSWFEVGAYKFYFLKRGNSIGIRLRTILNGTWDEYGGIETFPVRDEWVKKAMITYYDQPITTVISNSAGMEVETEFLGQITFDHNGSEYVFDVLDNGDGRLFLIIADQSNGDSTYGGGRYMYIPRPEEGEEFLLDLNKLHTPPCAYTEFATCPFPPKQNRLNLEINAGEKFQSKF